MAIIAQVILQFYFGNLLNNFLIIELLEYNCFYIAGTGLLSQLILLSDSLTQGGAQSAVQPGGGVQGVPPAEGGPPVHSIPPPPFSPGVSTPTDFSRFREATPRPRRPSRNRDSARHGSRSHGASRGGTTRRRSPSPRHRPTYGRGHPQDDQGDRPRKYRRGEGFFSDEAGSSSANSSSSSGASRQAPPPPPSGPQLDIEVNCLENIFIELFSGINQNMTGF